MGARDGQEDDQHHQRATSATRPFTCRANSAVACNSGAHVIGCGARSVLLSFPPRIFESSTADPAVVGAMTRGVFHTQLVWSRPPVGPVVLRVRFVGGRQEQRRVVLTYARDWSEHANVDFVESNAYDAEIRLGFDPLVGNWSYIGNNSVHPEVGYDRVSMNLANLDNATVLHEFGHALGLRHEHQHPDSPLRLNEQRVLDDMTGPPHFWHAKDVKQNILTRHTRDRIESTDFDPLSIMAYPLPARWLLSGDPLPRNERLSDGDVTLVQRIYGVRTS